MTIKEVEEATKLPRSNIRFYEKEGLVVPERNVSNGYREYSATDVDNIRKIAYLRTLGIPLEIIRELMDGKQSLYRAVKSQAKRLDNQMEDLENARRLCDAMLQDKEIHFSNLDVEHYVPDLQEQWKKSRNIFLMDSAGFLYLWGGMTMWCVLFVVSMITALLSYRHLPPEIPIQWSHGAASSMAGRYVIFLYPAACIVIRYVLRPFIWRWLYTHTVYSDSLADYITNSLCLVAVSVEIFTLLYVHGTVRHITVVLLADTIVLAAVFLAWHTRRHK